MFHVSIGAQAWYTRTKYAAVWLHRMCCINEIMKSNKAIRETMRRLQKFKNRHLQSIMLWIRTMNESVNMQKCLGNSCIILSARTLIAAFLLPAVMWRENFAVGPLLLFCGELTVYWSHRSISSYDLNLELLRVLNCCKARACKVVVTIQHKKGSCWVKMTETLVWPYNVRTR